MAILYDSMIKRDSPHHGDLMCRGDGNVGSPWSDNGRWLCPGMGSGAAEHGAAVVDHRSRLRLGGYFAGEAAIRLSVGRLLAARRQRGSVLWEV
jgi:hypothetical protein